MIDIYAEILENRMNPPLKKPKDIIDNEIKLAEDL